MMHAWTAVLPDAWLPMAAADVVTNLPNDSFTNTKEPTMTPPKTRAFARRQMLIGFNPEKGSDGRPLGSGALRLVCRNAYEQVGLRRPAHSAFALTMGRAT